MKYIFCFLSACIFALPSMAQSPVQLYPSQSSSEIQKAIDEAKENGSTILLNEGVYILDKTIEIYRELTRKADYRNIYELVGNLFSNAVHYNKNGGKIDVTIETSADGVRLTVEDSGIGIAKEHIPKLCERFYRVDKSRSKKTGGTGLGLAIVKHICNLYGAKLGIQSALGKGTKVTVDFKNDTAD